MAISSEASQEERSTTIPKGSTPKWVEAQNTLAGTYRVTVGDDIV